MTGGYRKCDQCGFNQNITSGLQAQYGGTPHGWMTLNVVAHRPNSRKIPEEKIKPGSYDFCCETCLTRWVLDNGVEMGSEPDYPRPPAYAERDFFMRLFNHATCAMDQITLLDTMAKFFREMDADDWATECDEMSGRINTLLDDANQSSCCDLLGMFGTNDHGKFDDEKP